MCVCALIYLLPGVKVSYYTVPEDTFYTVEAETLHRFFWAVAHIAVLILQAHTNSYILVRSPLHFFSLQYHLIKPKHLKNNWCHLSKHLHDIYSVLIML